MKIAMFLRLNFIFSSRKNTKDKNHLNSLDLTYSVGPFRQSSLS
jgi:hypothetical protein